MMREGKEDMEESAWADSLGVYKLVMFWVKSENCKGFGVMK